MIFYNYFLQIKHLIPNKFSRVDSTKFCSLRQLLLTYYVFKNHIRVLLGIYFCKSNDIQIQFVLHIKSLKYVKTLKTIHYYYNTHIILCNYIIVKATA